MNFLKPTGKPWRPTDFAYSQVRAGAIAPDVLQVLRTTALVESRADQYGDYLRAVFDPRGEDWRAAVDAWNQEESQHGDCLRRLCEAVDADFRFAPNMQAYGAMVCYHACDGVSVRGSIAAELVARCVVEALASTFYRVLADAVRDSTASTVLHTLARDEARHYGMFRAMLAQEQCGPGRLSVWSRLRVGIGRMLELSDDQIMCAAWLVDRGSDPTYRRSHVAQAYAAALYGHYRYEHLRYAARLLSQTLLGSATALSCTPIAVALWLGVRVRGALARWFCRRQSTARAAGGSAVSPAPRPDLACSQGSTR